MDRVPTPRPRRGIGPIGRSSRAVVGGGLMAVALAVPPGGLVWNLALHELILGLGAFPAMMVALSLLLRDRSGAPVVFNGQPGLVANCLLAVVLFSIPYTSGAAALFFGASMLLSAWRVQSGCEITVVSNLVLGRDDQVGCCLFGPVDRWEERRS